MQLRSIICDPDFRFQLTAEETEDLRSNFLTTNINAKSRYQPYVFTEDIIIFFHGFCGSKGYFPDMEFEGEENARITVRNTKGKRRSEG